MRVSRVFCWFQRPSLFALLALLLTATHCVDIDDRDLEVTEGDGDDDNGGSSNGGSSNGGSSNGGSSNGGSSNGGTSGSGGTLCAPDTDDNACSLCNKENCCDELTTCGGSIDCADFFYCIEPCLDDPCIEDCIAQYPVGAEQLASYLTCSTDYCNDACSGDT